MVIITEKIGQLCNRLFHFSYFIANSVEYDYRVIYPYFDDYADCFDAILTNNFAGYHITTRITYFKLVNKLLLRYLNRYITVIPNTLMIDIRNNNEIYDLKNEAYLAAAKSKMVFTKGWLFKDEENLKKHRDLLLQIFKPVNKYARLVDDLIANLRSGYDCIVGVHIRRGDYKDWNNGRYFYTDEVYLAKMEAVEQEITAQGKTSCFLICSNEPVNKTTFAHLNTSIEQRHFMVDLYSLAQCDYIVGPPSTFSYWASFYGNKPLHLIENATDEVSLNTFLYY